MAIVAFNYYRSHRPCCLAFKATVQWQHYECDSYKPLSHCVLHLRFCIFCMSVRVFVDERVLVFGARGRAHENNCTRANYYYVTLLNKSNYNLSCGRHKRMNQICMVFPSKVVETVHSKP